MRPLITCLLLCPPLHAAPPAAEGPANPPATATAVDVAQRDAALEQLLAERESPAALQRSIDKARKAGVSEQAIFEARFLFLVDCHDDDGIAGLLPDFTRLSATFKIEDSGIFAAREDWLAVGEYIKALAALKQGDKTAFKQHITEAFWLSPQQGAAFAPHIERLRLEEAMRAVRIDFDSRFKTINAEGSQSLKKIIGGNKALLLHFWSPWSDGSEAGMPDFTITARALAASGVAVASILPEGGEKILKDAAGSIKDLGAAPPGAWLIDDDGLPLHRRLRVRGFPTMVLVGLDGTILFNGDPTDESLWAALRKIDPEIRRPLLGDGDSAP